MGYNAPAVISLHRVQKVVDQRTVLDVDALHIVSGEVAAVVGAAGSGVESLLHLRTGRSRPTAGRLRVGGMEPVGDRRAFSLQIGVPFAADTLYPSRSPRGNLGFHARLRGLPKSRVDEVPVLVGLADHAGAGLDRLSSGMRRRLAYGIPVLHRPSVLILVEPFARCDDASITLLARRIAEHAEGGGAALVLAPTDAYRKRPWSR